MDKNEMLAELQALREEVVALRKDAERYRWLTEDDRVSPRDLFSAWWLAEQGWPKDISEAIDAAIGAKA